MKVILLNDIKNLGKKDEIVEVSDVYANSFLIKKKMALPANAKNLNELKLRQGSKEHSDALELQKAMELAAILENKDFVIKLKTGEHGKLYGSLTSSEVANILKEQGYTIDKKDISLALALKNVGKTTALLKLHNKVKININIIVESL